MLSRPPRIPRLQLMQTSQLRVLVLMTLLPLVVAACHGYGGPATDPRVVIAIWNYYNAPAAERDPGCDRPNLVLFRRLNTESSMGINNTLIMYAVYEYEQRRPGTGIPICSGTADRYFTVLRTDKGP